MVETINNDIYVESDGKIIGFLEVTCDGTNNLTVTRLKKIHRATITLVGDGSGEIITMRSGGVSGNNIAFNVIQTNISGIWGGREVSGGTISGHLLNVIVAGG